MTFPIYGKIKVMFQSPPTSHLVYVSKKRFASFTIDVRSRPQYRRPGRIFTTSKVQGPSSQMFSVLGYAFYMYSPGNQMIGGTALMFNCSTCQDVKISCFCSWPVLSTSHKISNTEIRREIRRVIIVGIFQGPPKLVCIILFNKHIHIGEHQKMIHG